jgi:hypothetical protein
MREIGSKNGFGKLATSGASLQSIGLAKIVGIDVTKVLTLSSGGFRRSR